MNVEFKIASAGELYAIIKVIEQARAAIASLGIDQWQNGHPSEAQIEADISYGIGMALKVDGIVEGYMALQFAPEPYYRSIKGKWLSKSHYATIHRMGVGDRFRHRGVACIMIEKAEEICRGKGVNSIRIDTHRGNVVMRCFLKRNGFIECGEVDYTGEILTGDPIRIAYEKLLDRGLTDE